jgi:hypothetical protein
MTKMPKMHYDVVGIPSGVLRANALRCELTQIY